MAPYTYRIITERSPSMARALALSKARALFARLEEMIFSKWSRSAIWRTAVNCRALAYLAGDKVLAENAGEIVNRFGPGYSAEERRAIHRKAQRLLVGFAPSRPVARVGSALRSRHATKRARDSREATGLPPAELDRVRNWLREKPRR